MPNTFRIILAEDDEDDQVLIRTALQEAQHNARLRIVGDGTELLADLAQGWHAETGETLRPHLILLDLNMPRMNGHEALVKIKGDPGLRSIPVVILTTSTAEEDIAASYDAGANSYISKPVGYLKFVDVLRGFGRYWTDVVTLPVPVHD
jgi:two-component system response regulator